MADVHAKGCPAPQGRRQRIAVFQQNGSAESKIAGIRKYGEDRFDIQVVSIDNSLPPILDDTDPYLPSEIRADLVPDFLRHPDLPIWERIVLLRAFPLWHPAKKCG